MTISRKELGTDQLQSLKMFLEAWHGLSRTDQTVADLKTSLATFFSKFRTLRATVSESKGDDVALPLNPDRLSQFCKEFRRIFDELQRQGEFINIWSFAGLKRDELRHAWILKWFLDPNASHGFKDAIFRTWMQKLRFSEESGLCDPQLWVGQYGQGAGA
jgi:hypothetical protein